MSPTPPPDGAGSPERRAGLASWVPGIRTARCYRRSWVRPDVVAGLVLAAILVPQGMAYAELAGLPPVTGLYTTIACLVGYALFGPSRVLVLGPDSSVSPMILAAVAPLVAADEPGRAIALAGMLALMVGFITIGLGLARLGFVANLLSREIQVGYMNGLALTIIVGQLPKLFGFGTDADSFLGEIRAFVGHLDETHAASLAIGLAALGILLGLPRLTSRLPAVLVAVVGTTVVSAVLGLGAHGVATVGTLPRGFPAPSLPWTDVEDVLPLLVAAVGITLVSLTDTIATAASFAARRGEEVDPDQEMIGIGAANVAASLVQGFAVSTSGSRTAVAEQAGARSQAAGLVGAGLVVLLLVACNSLLADLPQPTLAAVVIAAALRLSNIPAVLQFARARRSAAILSLTATAGVVALGVLEGIVVAVVLAVFLVFGRVWWPHGARLGRIAGVDGWHSTEAHPDAAEPDGIVVYRWEAPLFFANAGTLRDELRRLARDRSPAWIVLQCQAITDIDITGADMLRQLDDELVTQGVQLAFAGMRTRVQDLVARSGLFQSLGADRCFPTVDAALEAIGRDRRGSGDESPRVG